MLKLAFAGFIFILLSIYLGKDYYEAAMDIGAKTGDVLVLKTFKFIFSVGVPFIICYVIAHLILDSFDSFTRSILQKSETFFNMLEIQPRGPIHLYSTIVQGDEAGYWLEGMHRISESPNFLFACWSGISNYLMEKESPITTFLSFLAIILVYLNELTTVDGERIFMYIGLSIYAFLLLRLVIFIPIFLSFIPFSYLFKSNPLVHGWTSFMNVLTIKCFTSKLPPKGIHAEIKIYSKRVKRSRGLTHSEPYQNEQIIMDLKNWFIK